MILIREETVYFVDDLLEIEETLVPFVPLTANLCKARILGIQTPHQAKNSLMEPFQQL